MCGICGAIDLRTSGVVLDKLQAMNDAGRHRGPDDECLALFGSNGEIATPKRIDEVVLSRKYTVGLGHRRLSILDLSARGRQPMFDVSNRFCIVFNGEIYNHLELREELGAKGYRFTSSCDTEVILAAYKEWGIDCQRKFNGMWAFAILDRDRSTLFCSRDRFGIKPFYYAFGDGRFVFASEIKQILTYSEHLGIEEEILADFFFWGYETHTNRTFFRGISCLPQSHYLVINLNNLGADSSNPVKYWEYEPQDALPLQQAVETFRDLFTDAVKIRLRSDVPVGVTLSGGLDSSSVACTMASLLERSNARAVPNTFTVAYTDAGFSEKAYADEVVEKTGFNQFCVNPSSAVLASDWGKFIWHMEEPFKSLSYFSNWEIYKKAREENTPVILNGQGGDELLLGYDRYRVSYINVLLRQGKLLKVLSEINKSRAHGNLPLYKQLALQAYFALPGVRVFRRLHLVKPYLDRDFYDYYSRKRRFLVRDEFNNKDLIELQIKEFYRYQLQHLLRHEDRVSMAFSIEARLPFLDYRLFNLMLSQDDSQKLNSGWSKYILREAMNGYLPDSIKNRTDKMGFSTPIKRLFADNADYFLDILNISKCKEFLNVENIATDFKNNRLDANLSCSFLTFLSWRNTFNV